MFFRDTWAEIDLDQMRNNIKELTHISSKPFFAVIKANGYNCGDEYIARTAIENGAVYIAVSSLDEALALRNKGILDPILVLEYMNTQALIVARENNVTVTASSMEWVKEAVFNDLTGLKVHFKYDTGMNRIGFKNIEELRGGLSLLQRQKAEVEGIYTHFACSDNGDNKMCQNQLDLFREAVNALSHPFRWIHCANTDASLHFKDDISNATRCGIGMLGVASYAANLHPVMSLYSKIVHIKQVKKGESIGYGASYYAVQDEWIATIPIGYADGWIRKNQGRCCIVDGQECEFVGRICMDQAMIRLPKKYPLGTTVELIGRHMLIEKVAAELETIPYEVMTLLSDRVAKIYRKNNHIINILNTRLDENNS